MEVEACVVGGGDGADIGGAGPGERGDGGG